MKRKTQQNNEMEEFTAQHDQESRTVNLLRDQVRRSQEQLEFIGTRESSKILTH